MKHIEITLGPLAIVALVAWLAQTVGFQIKDQTEQRLMQRLQMNPELARELRGEPPGCEVRP